LGIELEVYKKWFETYLPEIRSTFESLKKMRGVVPDSIKDVIEENIDDVISWLKKLLVAKKHLDYDQSLVGILKEIQKLAEETVNYIHDLDFREKILRVVRLAFLARSELEGDYQQRMKIYGKDFEKYLPSNVDKLEPEHYQSLLYQAAKSVTKPKEKKERATLSRKDVAELLIQSYWMKRKLIGSEEE